MALAHKAFRFPAMSYLKLPDGFSWSFFHKQSIKKSLLCEDPTRSGQKNFNPQQTWPLLLEKTEIQCPKRWFGVRDLACHSGVYSRTLSWRKPHFVVSSGPKLIHSLKLIFNSKKKQDFKDILFFRSHKFLLCARRHSNPVWGKKPPA